MTVPSTQVHFTPPGARHCAPHPLDAQTRPSMLSSVGPREKRDFSDVGLRGVRRCFAESVLLHEYRAASFAPMVCVAGLGCVGARTPLRLRSSHAYVHLSEHDVEI